MTLLLWLGEKIQKMLHGKGEIIITMPKFSEKSLVEDYIIEKLIEKGWRFAPANELERESFSEPLLLNNLVRAIKKLNSGKGIGDEELKHVLNELKLKGSGNEGLNKSSIISSLAYQ